MSATARRAPFAPSPRPQARSSFDQLMLDLNASAGSFRRYSKADLRTLDWQMWRWLYLPHRPPVVEEGNS